MIMNRLFASLLKGTVVLLLMLGVQSFSFAQRTVTGTVKEAGTGEALIGATVLVKGTTHGTITDIDGHFTLDVPAGNDVLEISYTGFGTETVTLGSSNTVEVALTAGKALEEVVVTGYGSQRRKEVTSAVTSIKAEDFNKGAITSPAQLLQGKVPGLIIAKPNGDPNGGFSIRLRGLSTIGGNTEPLIIVDGVPGASLSSVDPNDIESMDVLKDGSAAAIYGTRGSNGVILITTKKGIEGKTTIEYSGIASSESLARTPDVMSAAEYKAVGGKDQGASTDWFKTITRSAIQHQHNLALSGGAKGLAYRAAFNFKDVPGVLINSGFKQLNGRLNLTQKALNNKLTVGLDIAATNRNQQNAFNDAFKYATIFNPTAPVLDSKNVTNGGYFEPGGFDYYNPLAIVKQNQSSGVLNTLLSTIHGEYEILKGLKYSLSYTLGRNNGGGGTDNAFSEVYISKQSAYGTGVGRNGLASRQTSNAKNDYLSSTLSYLFKVSSVELSALAGYDYQKFTYDGFGLQGGNFLTNAFTDNNIGASQDFPRGLGNVYSYKNSNKLIAFFGRLNANLNDTWFASASVRREGSSRFGANNKWGVFPAVSAGVNLSRLLDITGLDNLKLRVGYGVTGANISQDYLSQFQYGPTGNFYYNGNYVPTYGPISNPNPDLKWERKGETNVGVDFGLGGYKITGSLDYFHRNINDLLYNFQVPVPPNAFNRTWANVGKLNSSGLEALVSLNNLKLGGLKWTPSVNATFYLDNTLVSLSKGDLKFGSGGYVDLADVGSPGLNNFYMIRVQEGGKIGQITGPQYTGVDAAGNPIYKDFNGDGKGTTDDKTVLGNGLPTMTLGFNNNFTLGRWSLNAFLRGAFGHSLVNQFRIFYENRNAGSIQSYNRINTKLVVPAVKNAAFSSLYVEKGDFMRLDNMQLGYTLPVKGVFNRAFIYLAGNNLFTITNYTGVDPEVRFGDSEDNNNPLSPGIDRRSNYITTRAFSLGVNLGF
jgi:iron complex outermembrane receptor protein